VDSTVTQLADCIKPSKFESVVEAVKITAGYDEDAQSYEVPSLALKLGYSLSMCAGIMESKGLKENDVEMSKDAKNFEKLYKKEWCAEISKEALDTLESARNEKTKALPLAEDIVTLNKHIATVASKCRNKLVEDSSDETFQEDYETLLNATLTKIILFNRRRSGEASRMKIDDYTAPSNEQNPDILETLTAWEKSLCKKLKYIEVMGKRGRKVPILLTEEMKRNMELLYRLRARSGVNKKNEYFFALLNNNSLNERKGHEALKSMVVKANLKQPKLMTSTKLRKHVATITQLFNLTENELDLVAGFLGHDIRVHREYYRLPESTLQMAKVTRVLLAAEKGSYGQFKGKSLDEIEVESDGKFLFVYLFYEKKSSPAAKAKLI
jgi:hypothetical protein